MDKIAKSSYFQRAVDSKFVQRGMEYVSNKAINLQLEVFFLSMAYLSFLVMEYLSHSMLESSYYHILRVLVRNFPYKIS